MDQTRRVFLIGAEFPDVCILFLLNASTCLLKNLILFVMPMPLHDLSDPRNLERNILIHVKMVRETSFWLSAAWVRTTLDKHSYE